MKKTFVIVCVFIAQKGARIIIFMSYPEMTVLVGFGRLGSAEDKGWETQKGEFQMSRLVPGFIQNSMKHRGAVIPPAPPPALSQSHGAQPRPSKFSQETALISGAHHGKGKNWAAWLQQQSRACDTAPALISETLRGRKSCMAIMGWLEGQMWKCERGRENLRWLWQTADSNLLCVMLQLSVIQ